MHVSLASIASYLFYGRLLICIPLKAELETGTRRQLIWEVIPGSRSAGQENCHKESGNDNKDCVAELVIPLYPSEYKGTLVKCILEFYLQITVIWGIYLQTPIPHYLRGISRG